MLCWFHSAQLGQNHCTQHAHNNQDTRTTHNEHDIFCNSQRPRSMYTQQRSRLSDATCLCRPLMSHDNNRSHFAANFGLWRLATGPWVLPQVAAGTGKQACELTPRHVQRDGNIQLHWVLLNKFWRQTHRPMFMAELISKNDRPHYGIQAFGIISNTRR